MNIFTKFATALVFLTGAIFSEIITVDSITGLEAELNKADADTLVIFDCDDTLIHKTDIIFDQQNEKVLKRYIEFAIKKYHLEVVHLNEIKYIVMQNNNQVLVNEKLPNLISNLQTKGVKAIVLTALRNKILKDGSFIDLRIKELNKFGFDFSRNLSNLEENALLEDQTELYYKQGIVCSGSKDKSVALDLFLKYAGFYPKKIIFVDDKKENLVDTERALKLKGIDFTGIEYLEYKKIPYKYPFSEKRAIFQIEYLITNKIWLSDEEAELKLNEQ